MVYADLARKLERALNEALVKKQSILEQCVFEVEEAEKDLDRWRECARELAKIALKIRNDFLADNASVGNYSDGEFSQDYTTRVEGLQKALARFSELEKENKPQFSKPTETISFTCCGAGGHELEKENDSLQLRDSEKQRADQLGINCRWLIDKIDRVHRALCPGQYGTWQQRAEQAVEAAKRIAPND